MSTPVAIEITARLDKFREEMAKIPDIGGKEAKALTAQLSREIKAAEKAATDSVKRMNAEAAAFAEKSRKAAAGADDWASSLKDTNSAGTKALKALGPLGGVAAKLSPELGAAGSAAAGLTSGLEGLGAAGVGVAAGPLAAVAAAVAVLYAQYYVWNREQERADALLQFQADHADDLQDAQRELASATLAAAVATGALTKAEGLLEAARDKSIQSTEDFQAAQEKERAALESAAFEAQRSYERWETGIGILDTAIDYYGGYSATIRDSTTKLSMLDDIERQHQDTIVATVQAEEEAIKADEKAAKAKKAKEAADKAADKAAKAHAEELRREEAAQKALTDQVNAHLDAMEKIRGITVSANVAALDGEEAVIAKGEERLHQLDEEYTKALTLAATDDQRIAAMKANADAKIALAKQTEAEITKVHEEEAKKRKEIESAQVSAYADMAGAIASIAQTAGENLSEEQKEQALTLFAIQKAAAMAQAAINTVLAISEASTLPYPANIPAMAAAGAVGLAQEVAIAAQPAPSFNDTPAMMEMGQSGTVRLAAGDKFAASQTAEGLRAQVGASDPGADYRDGGNYAIVGARAYGRRITDDVRQRTPLSGILSGRRDRPLGQRA